MKRFWLLVTFAAFCKLAIAFADDSVGIDKSMNDTGTGRDALIKLHDNGDGSVSPQIYVSTPIDVTDATLNLNLSNVTGLPGSTPSPSPRQALSVQGYTNGIPLPVKTELGSVTSAPGSTPSPSPAKALAVQGIAGATAIAISNDDITAIKDAIGAAADPAGTPTVIGLLKQIVINTTQPIVVVTPTPTPTPTP